MSLAEKTQEVRRYCINCKKFISRKNQCPVFKIPYPLWDNKEKSEEGCWAREKKKKESDKSLAERMEGWEEVWHEDKEGRPGLKFGKSESYDMPIFTKNRMKNNKNIQRNGGFRSSRMAESYEKNHDTGKDKFSVDPE